MTPTDHHNARIDRETWKRLTHSQRTALAALADGPAVAQRHGVRAGRYWTLYSLPISRTTITALSDMRLVTVAGACGEEAASITDTGRSVLAAGGKGRAAA
jgi:hypothetical protein